MGLTLLLVQVVFGGLIVAFSLSRTMLLSEVLLFFAGSMLIMVFALVTSLVQLAAPNELRSRVMSIFMVSFRGGIPLGNLAAGFVASRVSAPFVLAVNGTLLAIVAGLLPPPQPRCQGVMKEPTLVIIPIDYRENQLTDAAARRNHDDHLRRGHPKDDPLHAATIQ